MAVTIITKNSDTAGSVPSDLAEGELAIDTTPDQGKIYYGNNVDRVSVVAQQPYISNKAVPPVSGLPKPGATWWQPDHQTLLFTADGVVFTPTAVPTIGGTFKGHVEMQFNSLSYFKTTDDVVGDQTNVKGVRLGGKLLCEDDVTVQKNLYVSDGVLVYGDLQVQQDTLLTGRVTKEGSGDFTHYADAGFSGGKITVSTGAPPSSGMVAGDIHFTITP